MENLPQPEVQVVPATKPVLNHPRLTRFLSASVFFLIGGFCALSVFPFGYYGTDISSLVILLIPIVIAFFAPETMRRLDQRGESPVTLVFVAVGLLIIAYVGMSVWEIYFLPPYWGYYNDR